MTEIKALTSLRGIAAMMIVMQHFSATAQRHAAVNIPSLVPHGYMAVDLFFVLSGFIMAYTYQSDFALRGNAAMPSFLLKRAARILPLNTVVVTAIALAGMVSLNISGQNIFHTSSHLTYDVICNLLLLHGLGFGLNLNGPSWSISTEFMAYLLFPLLIACVFSRRRLPSAAIVLLSVGALIVIALQHPRLGLSASSIAGELTLCLAQFVLGLFTYRVTRSPGMRARLQSDQMALLAVVWVISSLCLRLDLLAAMGFPVIVATLACNQGKVADWMAAGTLRFLGEISFSLYLIHDPSRVLALEFVRAIHPAPLSGAAALSFAFVASLLVIPLAWMTYIAIERPGRRVVRGLAAMVAQPVI